MSETICTPKMLNIADAFSSRNLRAIQPHILRVCNEES